MRVGIAAVVVLLGTGACLAGESKTMWEEYGQVFVGTWEANLTLDEDLPTGEKKGDTFKCEVTVRWIVSKKAIETDSKLGSFRGRTLDAWDPIEKCIRWHSVDSNGSIGGGTCKKVGENAWIGLEQSTSAEGVRSSNAGKLTISDGGNTHTWVTTDRKKGEQSLPDKTDVWRRVKK